MHPFERTLSEIALVMAGVLLGWLVLRVGVACLGRGPARARAGWPRLDRARRALRVAGAVLLGAGMLAYGLTVQRGMFFMPDHWRDALALLWLAWAAIEVGLVLRSGPSSNRFALAGSLLFGLATAALGALMLALHLASVRGAADPVLILAPPFDGEWVVTGGGATARTNHHHRIASQRHALDLARRCDDGRLFRGDGSQPEHSCTWGAVVRAPLDARVVRAVDGLVDGQSRRELAGNHVVLDAGGGRFVALAHLQRASVAVAEGQTVRRGDPIGRAGMSGNADFAHLHVHVQDGPDYSLAHSASLPFTIGPVDLRRWWWWQRKGAHAPIANDRLRPHEPF